LISIWHFMRFSRPDAHLAILPACCSLEWGCRWFYLLAMSLDCCSQHCEWVLLLLPERRQKLKTQICRMNCPVFCVDYYILYLQPLLGADEISE
jgi:hypothetical protein